MQTATQSGPGVPRGAILALATSSAWCSVALRWVSDGQWHSRELSEPAGQQHSHRALVIARELLADARLGLTELSALAFDAGPGSFTGIRIGCGLAQGLGFAIGKPLLAVSSLEALAWQTGATNALVAIDARMQQVYHGVFRLEDSDPTAIVPMQVDDPEQAACHLLMHLPEDASARHWMAVGDGFERYPALGRAVRERGLSVLTTQFARADAIAAIAWHRLVRGAGVEAAQAAPIYVRDKVALDVDEQRQARAARSGTRA
jgi:tRNA threonylcarbamoyladenosine biosynthesis protein TsaB